MSMLMALMLDDNAMVDMITDQAEPMPEAEAEPEDCAFSDDAWSICNTDCRKTTYRSLCILSIRTNASFSNFREEQKQDARRRRELRRE